ncbi:aconitate hydratase AcnA [Corallincola platygyrae]|uniref:Aconitate hydratase n=1 Tax=Corallincola platygyrae TaxID=1193278 RepID=A0ABW4XJK7_9GAMM
MTRTGHDSLKTRKQLLVGDTIYEYFSLKVAADKLGDISKFPFTLKVLLENLLRHEDGSSVTLEDLQALVNWQKTRCSEREIAYRPARVLMQDFTGVPAVVDLSAMREAMGALGGDPEQINPLTPVDLVIDHSVMVDEFGNSNAFQTNVEREFERNAERYAFLKWGQQGFRNFRVVPPGTGICHQVNLEYLGQTVWEEDGVVFPDTLVGTDSHTTMINGLSILGWGVGGIEAEAAMLGQPVSMMIPEVIGFKLTGSLPEGSTATDLVLTITKMLRTKGVVGKFVEFYGDGLDNLPLADRATIGNMSPEFGSTCAFFPIDNETLRYLSFTGRDPARIELVEAYAKAQGLWREAGSEPVFTDTLELSLDTVVPSIAGPKRPQDKIPLSLAASAFDLEVFEPRKQPVIGQSYQLSDGDVVIAAITSCTNTSNPSVMIGAGLLARKALKKGLKVKSWVKTSLAPGSKVVTDYLQNAGLQGDLDALGFNLVGYGCTTCIGNSGPLPEPIAQAVTAADLNVCGVLSGNRNFEGRINPHVKSNYLASPPLVVAYALAGSMRVDLYQDPLGVDLDGNEVYLKDIWPTAMEIEEVVAKSLTPEMFQRRYSNVFEGTTEWRDIESASGRLYQWDKHSTYVKQPPFFASMSPHVRDVPDIQNARCLALFGDSVTTDHISPAGSIRNDSPAGSYLISKGVAPDAFNSYGSRRGNHEVMMRGTFANIRIRNEMLPQVEGGYTSHIPSGRQMSIYDAAMAYQQQETPLVIFAGKEYGTGSSRDWAAKGTRLLGVRAVIAESFERIHRSNLVGMGVLPLQFQQGQSRLSLNLCGKETFHVRGVSKIQPRTTVKLHIQRLDGSNEEVSLVCRIDTEEELAYYHHGGILHYVLREQASKN